MARFAVTLPPSPGNSRRRAFEDVAELLAFGLRRAGHEAHVTESGNEPGCQHIVVGADLIRFLPGYDLEPTAVIYNLEQLGGDSHYLEAKHALYRDHPCWTYCEANADAMEAAGLCRPTVVPIGYAPEQERVTRGGKRDVDVLFYGALNERRQKVIDELTAARLHVVAVHDGVYGEVRDGLIARAKVVLNVHYYLPARFEIVRCGYLLANGACVVSENGDAAAERDFQGGVVWAEHAELTATVIDVLWHEEWMAETAALGREQMRARDEARILAEALG